MAYPSTTKSSGGFTVLELIVTIVFLLAIGTVFLVQDRNMKMDSRDSQRKIAINSMYYNLEDVYYAANHAYPTAITTDGLPGIDPELLKDPNGITIGQQNADYRYTPKDCVNGACKSYELRANLEAEADFVKDSRNK